MRYAIVNRESNLVENIVEWDGEDLFPVPDALFRQCKKDEECWIGARWDGRKYVDPNPPIPKNPMTVELESRIVAKPLEYNGIGWHNIAQGPLTPGSRTILEGKPGIWLVGDRIPGIEGYSVVRVA